MMPAAVHVTVQICSCDPLPSCKDHIYIVTCVHPLLICDHFTMKKSPKTISTEFAVTSGVGAL